MKKFITTVGPTSSDINNWNGNTGKFKQLFKSLTGYDIMFEESRKDLVPVNNNLVPAQSTQVLSGLLSNSIKKCVILLRRE